MPAPSEMASEPAMERLHTHVRGARSDAGGTEGEQDRLDSGRWQTMRCSQQGREGALALCQSIPALLALPVQIQG